MSQCLVCGKELRPVEADAPWQCHEAMAVEVHGGYGSRVYDPLGYEGAAVLGAICDGCATDALPRLWVAETKFESPSTEVRRVESWEEV